MNRYGEFDYWVLASAQDLPLAKGRLEPVCLFVGDVRIWENTKRRVLLAGYGRNGSDSTSGLPEVSAA